MCSRQEPSTGREGGRTDEAFPSLGRTARGVKDLSRPYTVHVSFLDTWSTYLQDDGTVNV